MNDALIKDAVLRIGEVSGIEGRKVFISLDKNKNSSELLYNGDVLKNISVGSYIEIRKGFLSIIGKAEGEKLVEDSFSYKDKENQYQYIDKNKRTLAITLSGYIRTDGRFIGGIKELPLIGNEAFILTEAKIHTIHNLLRKDSSLKINIAKTDIEEVPISFPVDGLFNSHIAIFGNTGSGKSNTLAALYQAMLKALSDKPNFENNCRFFIFDFNGEYVKINCITNKKNIYNLTTKDDSKDKIPMSFAELMDIETLSILLEATEKTQKPFLKRALRYYKTVKESINDNGDSDFVRYFKNILKRDIKNVLQMTNKDTAFKILDYLEEILTFFVDEDTEKELRSDIEFHNQSNGFFKKGTNLFYSTDENEINNTNLYKAAENINDAGLNKISKLNQFFVFLLLQLINDLYRYKVQIDHVLPVTDSKQNRQALSILLKLRKMLTFGKIKTLLF